MDSQERFFELLDKSGNGREIVIRDDQFEFPDMLDAVQNACSRGGRFNLIDTGRFGASELEWIGSAGAHVYTSDEARPNTFELMLIRKACLKGRALTALWQRGTIETEERSARLSLAALKELAGEGIQLHISNREHTRDLFLIAELAEETRAGGGFLVYYHHGGPVPELMELASRAVRIHISDRTVGDDDLDLMRNLVKAGRACGSDFILYIEKGMPYFFLRKLYDEGALLLFKTPPNEDRSAMGWLEHQARRRAPASGTYYLYTNYLL